MGATGKKPSFFAMPRSGCEYILQSGIGNVASRLVLFIQRSFFNCDQKQFIDLSNGKLADKISCSVRSIQNALKELEHCQVIRLDYTRTERRIYLGAVFWAEYDQARANGIARDRDDLVKGQGFLDFGDCAPAPVPKRAAAPVEALPRQTEAVPLRKAAGAEIQSISREAVVAPAAVVPIRPTVETVAPCQARSVSAPAPAPTPQQFVTVNKMVSSAAPVAAAGCADISAAIGGLFGAQTAKPAPAPAQEPEHAEAERIWRKATGDAPDRYGMWRPRLADLAGVIRREGAPVVEEALRAFTASKMQQRALGVFLLPQVLEDFIGKGRRVAQSKAPLLRPTVSADEVQAMQRRRVEQACNQWLPRNVWTLMLSLIGRYDYMDIVHAIERSRGNMKLLSQLLPAITDS